MIASGDRRLKQAAIDIDSFPIEVHGKQQGARYNGYYQKTVYHPLVASLSVGERMVKHARRLVLRIAESANPLWSLLIARIEA